MIFTPCSVEPGEAWPTMGKTMKRSDAIRSYQDYLADVGTDSDTPEHLRDSAEQPDAENMSNEDLTSALQDAGILMGDVVRDDDDSEDEED